MDIPLPQHMVKVESEWHEHRFFPMIIAKFLEQTFMVRQTELIQSIKDMIRNHHFHRVSLQSKRLILT